MITNHGTSPRNLMTTGSPSGKGEQPACPARLDPVLQLSRGRLVGERRGQEAVAHRHRNADPLVGVLNRRHSSHASVMRELTGMRTSWSVSPGWDRSKRYATFSPSTYRTPEMG